MNIYYIYIYTYIIILKVACDACTLAIWRSICHDPNLAQSGSAIRVAVNLVALWWRWLSLYDQFWWTIPLTTQTTAWKAIAVLEGHLCLELSIAIPKHSQKWPQATPSVKTSMNYQSSTDGHCPHTSFQSQCSILDWRCLRILPLQNLQGIFSSDEVHFTATWNMVESDSDQ